MFDARCANPEYQLDVDLMILEHALYHATRSQFDLLTRREAANGRPYQFAGNPVQAAESLRLLTIFDDFMALFRRNHPTHQLEAETTFNILILQFLVLLVERLDPVVADDPQTTQRHDLPILQPQHDSFITLQHRRRWLQRRERARQTRQLERQRQPTSTLISPSADPGDDSTIYTAWRHHALPAPDPHFQRQPLLFDLVPRFLSISAQVSDLLDAPPNADWMAVAAGFMLQAAIEALQIPLLTLDGADARATQYPQLDDCYAWGIAGPEDDDFVARRLFGAEGGAEPPLESPLWTQVRADSLAEFDVVEGARREARFDRLARLEGKYPREAFVQALVQFVEGMWTVGQQSFGKPVLVQMEEGHLNSLGIEGDDFDAFMLRVGLKRDDANGVLRLKL